MRPRVRQRSFGLLKGVHPLLTPQLLYALRAMGHGDELAVVDCNFPARSTAKNDDVVMLAGVDAVDALDAILTLMPLDYFEAPAAMFMSPEKGDALPPLGKQVHDAGNAAIERRASGISIQPLERFSFYERAQKSFCIVQAGGERRPYGNWILKKGVVGPDGNDLKPS